MNTLERGGELNRTSYELGVLFVHGVGQPSRGDTLVRFGDPLCECIREWCDGATQDQSSHSQLTDLSRAPVTLREAFLDPRGEDSQALPAPPHVELHLEQIFNGQSITNTWVLAESWWPKSFITPRYQDLARWGLLILPGIIASHCGEQGYRWWKQFLTFLSRTKNYVPRLLWIMLAPVMALIALVSFVILIIGYTAFSLALGCLLVAVVALLLVLAIPPIPWLRSAVLVAQRTLIGTVGDSYVFLASPIQEAAIISRLVSDIRWMTNRCTRLAIVAHSQGAAISDLALRTGVLSGFSQAALLVTFGSGIKKLHALKRKQETITWSAWAAITGLILVFAGLYLWRFLDVPFNEVWTARSYDFRTEVTVFFGTLFPLFGAVLWLLASMSFPMAYRFNGDAVGSVNRCGIGIPWHDYYASMDPVPNGPLLEHGKMPSNFKSTEVHNFSSTWRDHTTYWRNKDGFVVQVARVISQFANFPFSNPQTDDDERLMDGMRRRRWRVSWLMAARFFAFMTALVVIIGNTDRVGQIGLKISELVFAYWSVSVISQIQRFLPIDDVMTQWLIGGGGVILCVLLGYWIVFEFWRLWNEVDTKALFRRSGYSTWPLWLFVSVSLLFIDIALFVRFEWFVAAMRQPEPFLLVILIPPSIAAFIERAVRTLTARLLLFKNLDVIWLPGKIADEILKIFEDICFGPIPLLILLGAPLSAWLVSRYSEHLIILATIQTVVHLGVILYYKAFLREVLLKNACLGRQSQLSSQRRESTVR